MGNIRQGRHVIMGIINPFLNIEGSKLICVHTCTNINLVHVCTKTLHRQLAAVYKHSLLTPINNRRHISKESHA